MEYSSKKEPATAVPVPVVDLPGSDCQGGASQRARFPNSTTSIPIVRRQSTMEASLELDPHTLTFCRYRKRMSIACDDELFMREADMNHIRLSIGLYNGYPLVQKLLVGAPSRYGTFL